MKGVNKYETDKSTNEKVDQNETDKSINDKGWLGWNWQVNKWRGLRQHLIFD